MRIAAHCRLSARRERETEGSELLIKEQVHESSLMSFWTNSKFIE